MADTNAVVQDIPKDETSNISLTESTENSNTQELLSNQADAKNVEYLSIIPNSHAVLNKNDINMLENKEKAVSPISATNSEILCKDSMEVDNEKEMYAEICQQNIKTLNESDGIDKISFHSTNISKNMFMQNENECEDIEIEDKPSITNLNEETKPIIDNETLSTSEDINAITLVSDEEEKNMEKDNKVIEINSSPEKGNFEAISKEQTNKKSSGQSYNVERNYIPRARNRAMRNRLKNAKENEESGNPYIGKVKWQVTDDEVYKMTEEELQQYYRSKRLEMNCSDEEIKMLKEKIKVDDREEYVFSTYSNNGTWKYICHICETNDLNYKNMSIHLQSKKHTKVLTQGKVPLHQFAVRIVEGTRLNCGLVEDKQLKTTIEKTIDNCNKHLIGIEYIVEVLGIQKGIIENKNYVCLLCDSKLSSSTVFAHLQSTEHRKLYLEMYFPKLFKVLTTTIPENDHTMVLTHVIGRIQYVHGRLSPVLIQRVGSLEPWKKPLRQMIDSNCTHIRESAAISFTQCVNVAHANARNCLDNWKKRPTGYALQLFLEMLALPKSTEDPFFAAANKLLNPKPVTSRRGDSDSKSTLVQKVAKTIPPKTNNSRNEALKRNYPFKKQEEVSVRSTIMYSSTYNSSKQQRLDMSVRDNRYSRNTATNSMRNERSRNYQDTNKNMVEATQNLRSNNMVTDNYHPRSQNFNQRRGFNDSVFEKNINSNYKKMQPPALATPLTENQELIAVLRKILVLENYLGLLGQKVLDLLSESLKIEKYATAGQKALLSDFNNCILLETVKEKLTGLSETGILDAKLIDLCEVVIRMITQLTSKNHQTPASNSWNLINIEHNSTHYGKTPSNSWQVNREPDSSTPFGNSQSNSWQLNRQIDVTNFGNTQPSSWQLNKESDSIRFGNSQSTSWQMDKESGLGFEQRLSQSNKESDSIRFGTSQSMSWPMDKEYGLGFEQRLSQNTSYRNW